MLPEALTCATMPPSRALWAAALLTLAVPARNAPHSSAPASRRPAAGALLLVSGETCLHLAGCRAAASAAECSAWASALLGSPQRAATPLHEAVPLGCYLFGATEQPYFRPPGASAALCSQGRKCVCSCSRDASTTSVAVYVGDGTTARARRNPIAVFNRAGTGVRAVNFTTSDVSRHLNTSNYDAVLFPGGGGGEEASALGAAGQAAVRSFVSAGGGYVGICAGAFLAMQHLGMSLCRDIPRPVPGKERGDGNVTLSLSSAGSRALSGFNVTRARLNGLLVFYANGPVMELENHPSAPARVRDRAGLLWDPEVLLTFQSKSVPIEAGYSGPYAGGGAAAVCSNRYRASAEDDGGVVLVSGPHPETDQMNFPARSGPPARWGSERAALLVSYVKHAAGAKEEHTRC